MKVKIDAELVSDLERTLTAYRRLLVTLYGNNHAEIEEVERQMRCLDRGPFKAIEKAMAAARRSGPGPLI